MKNGLTKRQQMQAFLRYYREQTGESEIDMHKVAEFAHGMGWQMPRPADPLSLLAAEFSQAAREEIRKDQKTGRPYRVNHAYPIKQGTEIIYLWVDIEDAPRRPMQKALVNRREQMVGDALQINLDAEHWSNINPAEQPIVMPLDFTDDVEWRKNGPDTKAN